MNKKIIIELTNRCNLNCQHCFSGRHGGRDDLPLPVLEQILAEARMHGFTLINFTGGDPTVYRHFTTALELTCTAGYTFSLNTNGWNFQQIYPRLLAHREQLGVITFSLDGATEATHDQLRGKGSYRRVFQAVSICVVHKLPFTLNMVVTAHNRHELAAMADLAYHLGSRGLRFGHLMHSPLTTAQGFDLSPWERKIVDAEIQHLRRSAGVPILMAPGYHTSDLFPCAPLHLEEVNIDCHGNVTTCCHLSGQSAREEAGDVMGNLQEISFGKAYARLQAENERFRQMKLAQLRDDQLQDIDLFPCWYCSNHYRKVDWLQSHPAHAWTPLRWADERAVR